MSIQTDSLKSSYNIHYANGERALKDGNKAYACEEFLSAAMAKKELANLSNGSEKDEHQKTAEMLLRMVEKLNYEITAPKVQSNKTESQPVFKEGTKSDITFADVAGLEEVKIAIRKKVLNPLNHPEIAARYGIKAGAQVLLYGPPGTGKTFIAQAIAGEVDAKFFSVNCSDLIDKFLGESSKNLVKLFESAKQHEKAIIFFDEFQSLSKKRGGNSDGAEAEVSRLVDTFLTLIDGVKKESANKMLILLAATNLPWEIDPAMLRGKRFDTHIYVGVPDQEAREFLVNKALKGMPMDADVNLVEIAQKLEGYSGADISVICDQIKQSAFDREIEVGTEQNITKEDCDNGIMSVQNMINPEMLARFEEFRLKGK